jgi:hypothetical protein
MKLSWTLDAHIGSWNRLGNVSEFRGLVVTLTLPNGDPILTRRL